MLNPAGRRKPVDIPHGIALPLRTAHPVVLPKHEADILRMPTYFISHGGGPWPWMPDWRAMFGNLEASIVQMVKDLPERPRAILMISGHWEDDSFAVRPGAQPPMVYDCSGFPPGPFHNEDDHFVPLFDALGAAEAEAATVVYHDTGLFGGVTASSYRIGQTRPGRGNARAYPCPAPQTAQSTRRFTPITRVSA